MKIWYTYIVNMYHKQDIEKNRVLAALGYLGILCFVPLLLRKKSPYAQFHAKQGVVLFVLETFAFFFSVVPILGHFIWLVTVIAIVILSIVGYVKALTGEAWSLPLLSRYTRYIEL